MIRLDGMAIAACSVAISCQICDFAKLIVSHWLLDIAMLLQVEIEVRFLQGELAGMHADLGDLSCIVKKMGERMHEMDARLKALQRVATTTADENASGAGEKRVDPADNCSKSFVELAIEWANVYSPGAILRYWDVEMRPAANWNQVDSTSSHGVLPHYPVDEKIGCVKLPANGEHHGDEGLATRGSRKRKFATTAAGGVRFCSIWNQGGCSNTSEQCLVGHLHRCNLILDSGICKGTHRCCEQHPAENSARQGERLA